MLIILKMELIQSDWSIRKKGNSGGPLGCQVIFISLVVCREMEGDERWVSS